MHICLTLDKLKKSNHVKEGSHSRVLVKL